MSLQSAQNVRFGDVARNIKVTVDPETSELEFYIAGEHMDTDDLKLRRRGTIGDGYLGPAFHVKFTEGQILYGSRRTYLRKVAVADFDGICANTTFVIEAIPDKIYPPLLPFIMQSEPFTQHSIQKSRGSTNPYIVWSDIACYEFALPPLDEQRRIAEILWAVDEAIESNGYFAERLAKTRILVFEDLVRWFDPNGNCEAKLERALVDIIAGKSPRGAGKSADPDEYGVLKVSAIGEYAYFEQENKALIDPNDFLAGYEVQAGYLLVTRANALKSGVARACIVESTRPGLMLSDKTLRLIVNPERTSNRYLLEALRTRKFRKYVEIVATGTEAKNISQDKLSNAPIPLLPREAQKQIEEKLYLYDNSLRTAEKHVNHLIELKRALLHNAL